MAKQEEYQRLLASFRTIRDERGVAQNTAVRIGTAFIELLRFAMTGEFDEITFNKVLNKPTFLEGLISLGTIVMGEYAEGLKGGIITPEGAAELKDLWVREHTKLGDGQIHRDEAGRVIPALEVKGDSTFTGNLSSPEFVSAFFGGLGWAIQKKEVTNAAGETEIKYHLEIDEVTVRNTLRVFEMIISQLLGENGNRFFSDMMEVDHYDQESGKVYLKTQGGRLYNPFRVDDIIFVQQYNGDPNEENNWYVTKAYELHVTAVGVGETQDGEERLDWVTFDNFTTEVEDGTPELLIHEYDTFVRADNLTNEQRKGLLSFMSVGDNTPYMDILYGQKTDPKHALKGRTGNLTGIRTDLFGWLEGFGAYLNNLYGVGKFFNAQTGESLQSRVEMSLQRFRSFYKETTYNISDDDNFVANGFFQEGLEPWEVCHADGSEVEEEEQTEEILGAGGVPVLMNGEMWAVQKKLTAQLEDLDGINVLHLRGMGVCQPFSAMKAKGSHKEMTSINPDSTETSDKPDSMFIGVRIQPVTSGTLKVLFIQDGGAQTGWEIEIEDSLDWILYQGEDSQAQPWNWSGDGKCVVSYTGECYIRFVALCTDAISTLKTEYSTLIEQTARRITLEAARQDSNLQTAVASLELEYDHLQTTVTDNKDAADRAFANITDDLAAEELARQQAVQGLTTSISGVASDLADEVEARESLEVLYKATWVYQNDSLIALMAAQFNNDGTIKGYSDLQVRVEEISTTVTNNKSAADAAFSDITSSLSSEVSDRKKDDRTLKRSISGVASDLADEVEARESLEDLYKATWVYQNDNLIALIAAQFNNDGTIIGYADLQVQVEEISSTVTNNKTAADNAFATLNNTTLPGLSDRITAAQTAANNAASAAAAAQGTANSAASAAAAAQGTADSAVSAASYNATLISQLDDSLSIVAANFDSQGNPNFLSGYMLTSSFSGMFTQALGSQDAQGTIGVYIADKAQALGLQDTAGVNQLISVAHIRADYIDFGTSYGINVTNSNDETIFHLDGAGNLTVKGTINGGTVTDNISIGTVGTNRMVIEPTSNNGARLVGYDVDNHQSLVLGFGTYGGSNPYQSGTSARLMVSTTRDSVTYYGYFAPTYLELHGANDGEIFAQAHTEPSLYIANYYGNVSISVDRQGKIHISAPLNSWPGVNDVSVGELYINGDDYLELKTDGSWSPGGGGGGGSVTAGTYTKVTVNSNGIVTSGENPTTLAGYGITDAAASNHTHTGYAASNHNHDGTYAPYTHTHSDYAVSGHTHDGRYYISGRTIYLGNDSISVPSSGGSITGLSYNSNEDNVEASKNLWLHTGNSNYGSTLYFGDKSYAFISEYADDRLKMYAYKDLQLVSDGNYTLTIKSESGQVDISGNWNMSLYLNGYSTNDYRIQLSNTAEALYLYGKSHIYMNQTPSTSSDQRMKDEIAKMTYDIGWFAEAPLVSFKWKVGFDENVHIGTYAQYWQDKIPEIVDDVHEVNIYGEKNGASHLSLRYEEMLTAGMVTAAREIVKLRNELNELKQLLNV